jgi:adenosylhomocysteine nucleosidase
MILVLVAIDQELTGVTLPEGYKVVEIGVGKVNATGSTVQAILRYKPIKIINFGTAGSLNKELKNGLYRVSKVRQRDMDCRPFGIDLGVTPYDAVADIDMACDGVTLGTGDSFVTSAPELVTDLVDMEGYAVAKAADRWNIPCEIYKFVSDFADDNAINDWDDNVSNGAELFARMLDKRKLH